MTKVNIRPKIIKKLNEVESLANVDQLKQEIGKEAVRDMKTQSRAGFGVEDSKRKKFKSLAPTTVAHREYLKRAGNRHPSFSSHERSNLTVSGQLLESIRFKVLRNGVQISVQGTRKPYKTLSGVSSVRTTNKQVAEGLADMGRFFLGVSDRLKKTIKTLSVRFIRRRLARR